LELVELESQIVSTGWS